MRLVFLIFHPSEVCSNNRPFQSILIRVLFDLYFLFFSLPKFAKKIGQFWKFSYGPPFAILRKMAILVTIEKRAISLLLCLFSSAFLRCNNVWQWRLQSILIRVLCDLYFLFFTPPKFAQIIGHCWKFSYGPPFAILRKMATSDTIEKRAISLPLCLFSCAFMLCNNLWQ